MFQVKIDVHLQQKIFHFFLNYLFQKKVTLTPNINLNKNIIICANIFPQIKAALLGKTNVGKAIIKTNIKAR